MAREADAHGRWGSKLTDDSHCEIIRPPFIGEFILDRSLISRVEFLNLPAMIKQWKADANSTKIDDYREGRSVLAEPESRNWACEVAARPFAVEF
jgi:hypothetical protein